jgi:hypothetical protein
VVAFPGRRTARPWLRLAAAAALVMGAGLAYQAFQVSPPLPPPPAGGTAGSGGVEVSAPRGELAAAPQELRWRDLPGAVAYRVRLHSATDVAVWEGQVARPPVTLPEGARDALQRAVGYTWSVEALDRGGAVIGRSPSTGFRLEPLPETDTATEPTAPAEDPR